MQPSNQTAKRPIYLGIDLGTTVLKICAFDGRSGSLLGKASQRLPVREVPGGGREQDMETILTAFQSLAMKLRRALGEAWNRIEGIGLSAQGGSSILADRTHGTACTPMYLWNDGRAQFKIAELAQTASKQSWRKFTLNDVPPHGLGRMAWLKENLPHYFNDDILHIGAGEFLFFHLTGYWRQDPCNALQIGSYNAAQQKLDDFLLKKIGVPISFVTPIRQGHEVAPLSETTAARLRLPKGIFVAGPYIDQEAGYLAAAGSSISPLQCSLGTAWVGNFALPDNAVCHSAFQLAIPSPVGEGRLVIQPLLSGNPAWDWALRQFVHSDQRKAIPLAEDIFKESWLPPEGLIALPWFSQANPIQKGVYGGGAIFGLSDQTKAADPLRSVALGMVCELRRVFDKVIQSKTVDRIVLGGGASKGDYFRRLIATIWSPFPVYWLEDEDMVAARGAIYSFSSKAAASKTVRIKPLGLALREELQKRYLFYLELFNRLYRHVPAGYALKIERREG